MKQQFFKEWVMCVIAGTIALSVFGQSKAITLDEAISIARNNYAGLERDRLTVEKYNKLATTGLPAQPTQLYVSGEEFGSNGQSGVHSLNVFQNFYLPKASKAQRAYYQKGAVLAEQQLQLTDWELKRQVELAFYQLQYANEAMVLVAENASLYNDFLTVTTAQLETGETGRLPQMAARTHLGQAQLEQEHAKEAYQIALSLFNQWLQSDSLYEAAGSLPLPTDLLQDTLQANNPHLQIIQAQKELAATNIETQKAQLLPQINSGFKLQNAFGNFPLFGYQIGVNVPLFKKAYQGRIEAAEIEVKVQEAALKTEQQKLQRTISELQYRIEHQGHILEYLQEDLTPLVNEQSAVNLQAYREGEIGYLEYLDSLEQVVKVKQQYLEALYTFQVLKVELEYWMGQ
jgi:cobalt-zinc-cadmium resistance protein CzcA